MRIHNSLWNKNRLPFVYLKDQFWDYFFTYTMDLSIVIYYCKMYCFADDSKLYQSFRTKNYHKASTDVITDWEWSHEYAIQHNSKFNSAKRKAIPLCTKEKKPTEISLKSSWNDESVTLITTARNLDLITGDQTVILWHFLTFKLKKLLCESFIKIV